MNAVATGMRPLERPPESMRPDRPEVITPLGGGPTVAIAPGVVFECLVGKHNQARQLTTGLVRFDPAACLPYHTHPFSESITLLGGEAHVEVEGRCYELRRLDNIVVPPDVPHAARNSVRHGSAVFHIAMATDSPSRTLVYGEFSSQFMPDSFAGQAGAERVNRTASAARFAAAPNTEFVDFFNQELLPGMEMSGGYGLFHPGSRLPAHVHDFDESICIIDGTATCVVEGRRYTLSNAATAMVPRGRVHYFINESTGPMAMLWVYAGPMPIRIVVDERCATVEGDPWRAPQTETAVTGQRGE